MSRVFAAAVSILMCANNSTSIGTATTKSVISSMTTLSPPPMWWRLSGVGIVSIGRSIVTVKQAFVKGR
jgi:hypothetical protein